MFRRRYSKCAIDTYLHWIRGFIISHQRRHPAEIGDADVEAYLTYLAVDQRVAQRTQAVVLNALCFLYRHIVQRPLSLKLEFVRSDQPRKLPVVLTREEVIRLLQVIAKAHFLSAALM